MAILAPSILSADFAELAEDVARAERGGAKWVHVDVMDGHFVPNLTMGPCVLKCLRQRTNLYLDVHLMVEAPDYIIPSIAEAGADSMTVHVEGVHHLHRTIALIKEQRKGIGVGVALNPATPISTLEEILPCVDMVLLMSVNPGYGGQSFITSVQDKLRRLREFIDKRGLNVKIQMDGGIGADNVGGLVKDGLDIVVAGSAVFKGKDAESRARGILDTMNAVGAQR